MKDFRIINMFKRVTAVGTTLLLLLGLAASNNFFNPSQNESFPVYKNISVREMVESRGFVYEEYHVTTNDSYILTVMRVVGH